MQHTADFFVAGSNPGRANMAAAPPMKVDQRGFEPPTKKYAADCVTIRPWFIATVLCIPIAWTLLTTNIMPWDDIWDDNLGLFDANDPKKGGYTTPAPALDLTTSVRGDWYFTKGSVVGAPLPDPPPPPSGGSHDPPPPRAIRFPPRPGVSACGRASACVRGKVPHPTPIRHVLIPVVIRTGRLFSKLKPAAPIFIQP